MKHGIKLLAGLLAFTMVAGCSKDSTDDGSVEIVKPTKDAVFMKVDLQLATPQGSRSQTNDNGTSTGGVEIGHDVENNVNTLLLVLATKDNKYITHASIGGLSTKADNSVEATMAFDQTKLSEHYNTATTGKLEDNKIRVYAFCNYTADLLEMFDKLEYGKDWIDAVCNVKETPAVNDPNSGTAIWADNNFLMSNADNKTFTKKIPYTLKDWQDKHTSEDNPFHLSKDNELYTSEENMDNDGAINVERSIARFDFKDGSGNNNTYIIQYNKDEDGKDIETKPTLQVHLVNMSLVNMSNKFYYIRRIATKVADGNIGTPEILGVETSKNYVVDPDYQQKIDNKIGTEGEEFSKHFNFCLGHGDTYSHDSNKNLIGWTIDVDARRQWYTTRIEDILKGKPDNYEGWTPGPNGKSEGYHIWRYVTENTIPRIDDQQHGISTGIVFKGKLQAGAALEENSRLYRAINGLNPDNLESAAKYTAASDYPIIFLFDNVPYVGWTDVKNTVANLSEGAPLTAAYEAVDEAYKAWMAEKNTANTSAFKKAATKAGFTLYEASNDAGDGLGYYFYYYYWNRHNDNGNPGVMGNMEFAVVRNNVYKLSVNSIKRLGHPRTTENDPDPEDPTHPDEKGDVYLDVSVQVLPWTVRVNGIDF